MGRRRKALESSLELIEGQHFLAVDVIRSFRRLARTLLDQLVTGECLELLDDLGEEIQVSICYSDYIYRHPEEWGDYAEEWEIAALKRLLCREAIEGGKR